MESNSNPSKIIKVSAPGKIHLIGEHSAVYGKPAILAAINLRFHATLSPSSKKEISGIIQYDDAIQKFQTNLEKLISEKFKIENIPNYKIEFKNELPLGSGLGSSAAFCAIFTAALLEFLNINVDLETLNNLTYEGEKIFNGNPSGGDNTTVIYGGLIWYRKETPDIKTYSKLSFKTEIKNFILIDSGKPLEKTSEMVTYVSSRSTRKDIDFKQILESQEILTKVLATSLKENNQQSFIEVINKAGKNLEKLGVVSKSAKVIIQKIQDLDGAAKITGAGGIKQGSGMILAYHKDLNKIIQFAKESNLKYYSIQVSEKGVSF